MTNIHETAYPRLKQEFTEQELGEIYTPSRAQIDHTYTAKLLLCRRFQAFRCLRIRPAFYLVSANLALFNSLWPSEE